MNPTEIADVIDLAVENLEQCPWGQSNGRIFEGQICAQDAIWMAAAGQQTVKEYRSDSSRQQLGTAKYLEVDETCAKVASVISMRLDSTYYDRLFLWNDRPGRTKDEVIELFKETAKDLRNNASPT